MTFEGIDVLLLLLVLLKTATCPDCNYTFEMQLVNSRLTPQAFHAYRIHSNVNPSYFLAAEERNTRYHASLS